MNGNELRELVSALYSELESISHQHSEVADTAVREALHEVLSWYFVWGNSLDGPPTSYAMFSAEGNARVADAVSTFLRSAAGRAADVPLGQARLDVLQDSSIETDDGECYDLFIGHLEQPLSAKPPSADRFRD